MTAWSCPGLCPGERECRLLPSRTLFPPSEQGRPHPYHRRALGHRQLNVIAHAHRERVDLRMLRGQRIEPRLHADEGLPPAPEVRLPRGDRHPPAPPKPRPAVAPSGPPLPPSPPSAPPA